MAAALLRRAGALPAMCTPFVHGARAAARKGSSGLTVFVRIEGADPAAVEVDPAATAGDLRTAAAAAAGADPASLALRWRGRALADAEALADAGVCAQSVVDAAWAAPLRFVAKPELLRDTHRFMAPSADGLSVEADGDDDTHYAAELAPPARGPGAPPAAVRLWTSGSGSYSHSLRLNRVEDGEARQVASVMINWAGEYEIEWSPHGLILRACPAAAQKAGGRYGLELGKLRATSEPCPENGDVLHFLSVYLYKKGTSARLLV